VTMKHVVIDSEGLITNIVLWDGDDSWQPPENCTTFALPEDAIIGIGWSMVGDEFLPPPMLTLDQEQPTPIQEDV